MLMTVKTSHSLWRVYSLYILKLYELTIHIKLCIWIHINTRLNEWREDLQQISELQRLSTENLIKLTHNDLCDWLFAARHTFRCTRSRVNHKLWIKPGVDDVYTRRCVPAQPDRNKVGLVCSTSFMPQASVVWTYLRWFTRFKSVWIIIIFKCNLIKNPKCVLFHIDK